MSVNKLVKEFTKTDEARARKGRSVQVAVGWDDREVGELWGRTEGEQKKKKG